MPPGRPPLDRG